MPSSELLYGVALLAQELYETFLAYEWSNLYDMRFGMEWRNELLNEDYDQGLFGENCPVVINLIGGFGLRKG